MDIMKGARIAAAAAAMLAGFTATGCEGDGAGSNTEPRTVNPAPNPEHEPRSENTEV